MSATVASRCDEFFAAWDLDSNEEATAEFIRSTAREDPVAFEQRLSQITPSDERTSGLLYQVYEALCSEAQAFEGLLSRELDRMLRAMGEGAPFGHAWEAALAFQTISGGAPPKITERLLRAIDEPFATIRAAAVEILDCVAVDGHGPTTQKLVWHLFHDEDWTVRARCFEVIVERDPKTDATWFELERAMNSDDDWRVRHHACRSCQSPEVAPRVSESLSALLRDAEFRVRRAAFLALQRGAPNVERPVSFTDRVRIFASGGAVPDLVFEDWMARHLARP
jgi:hypothetical protein